MLLFYLNYLLLSREGINQISGVKCLTWICFHTIVYSKIFKQHICAIINKKTKSIKEVYLNQWKGKHPRYFYWDVIIFHSEKLIGAKKDFYRRFMSVAMQNPRELFILFLVAYWNWQAKEGFSKEKSLDFFIRYEPWGIYKYRKKLRCIYLGKEYIYLYKVNHCFCVIYPNMKTLCMRAVPLRL